MVERETEDEGKRPKFLLIVDRKRKSRSVSTQVQDLFVIDNPMD